MKRRFTEEQIIVILQEVEAGVKVKDLLMSQNRPTIAGRVKVVA